jgi:hypothetical protein
VNTGALGRGTISSFTSRSDQANVLPSSLCWSVIRVRLVPIQVTIIKVMATSNTRRAMPTLFKDGAGTLEQGLDLVRRGDYARAREKFLDATRKFSKEGSLLYPNLAKAYADLLSPDVMNGSPGALMALSSFLRSTLGTTELKLGPRGISASDLATELELTTRDTNLMNAVASGTENPTALAQALQELASAYGPLGSQVLYLPELFHKRATTAESRVPVLMALSFEILGTAVETTDPLTAAEHFQTAQQYWSQANDEPRSQAAANRAGHLSIQAKCWICGREGIGHGIQFVSLPVLEGVSGLKDTGSSPLPSLDSSGLRVYVCKGCFSALHGLADKVAIQRAVEVEQRLLTAMQAMEQRLQNRSVGSLSSRN